MADNFRSRAFGVFAYRDYRFLWVALVLGSIGVWMRILATAQWLLDETGSAYMVGLIGIVQLVVQIPITFWAGTLADRVDRKKIMLIANAVTAATLIGAGLLNYYELLTPALVYGAVAITSATYMINSPARSALIPIIIAKQDLMLASSTDTASSNAAAIAGPLLFAFVAVTTNLTVVFILAGAITLTVSFMPLLVRATGRVEQDESAEQLTQFQQTREGIRYIVNHPILPGLFLLDAGITTASFYREILPVLALGLFAGGASATGMLGAANSGGAILGSMFVLLFIGYKAPGMLVLYASFAYGVILFGFGTATSLGLGMLMIALLGAADAVTVAVRQTTVMLTTPDHVRGRAFAMFGLAAQTANNVGTIWVGFWAGAIGAGNTMVMGGFISIAATALIWWFWKPIREFRSG